MKYVKHWRKLADELAHEAQGTNDEALTSDIKLYRNIANSLYSSLTWSAQILLNREWDTAKNDNFAELIGFVKKLIRDNQKRLE